MRFVAAAHDNMFQHALRRHPGAAEAKWPNLSTRELSDVTTERRFAATVAARDGIGMAAAEKEVHSWVISQS